MLLMSFSCEDKEDDRCINFSTAFVTSVNAPETGSVSETIPMEIKFLVNNGCTGFEKFIETRQDKLVTVEVETRTEGCICTLPVLELPATYEFTPESPGDYQLNFKSGPSDFITVDLTIN